MKTLILACVLSTAAIAALAQSPSTTTVQGTVYNAAGAPISGTLQLSWPAFTTAANQAIAAGRLSAAIGADGFLSVNLAPNMGATPAGLYYTAVYHLADGTTSTEYWVVPAAPQATLAAVRAQVMPAAQAVQAVNKAYVDQAIQQYATNQVSTFGGTFSGPLYLNGDPLIPTQAADKHYVDNVFGQALSAAGGNATGPLSATRLGGVYQADQAPGVDFTSKLQACINNLDTTYGGTCDARNYTGSITMSAPLTIATANVTVQFPCATIATAYPIVIAPGTRNVTLHGCATRGTSSASGSQGGTVFLFSGSAALFQIGDSTYATDTTGFHLDNIAVNTTAATAATAQALAARRTQEMQLTSLYLLGNSNQTALTLDGTGNYTGGTFQDIQIGGYLTAINAIGHQVSNPATTDWLNASTFVRLHIDCPTSNGNPIAGTTGINLQQGDGNTFTGGDVESCGTVLHLGANAQNNTILGLRNENSTYQVVADSGSSYNNWITGGTMFNGRLADNGTRNSFLDTFHRSFNALNGDWYGSQQDSTITNHFRLGIGSGSERGLLNRYQTDYGYRWTTGLSDASAGEQFYQVLDELNNVNRISIGQYNNGQASTNNQTVINSAGSGAIVLNGSTNAGTGGVLFGSGGATGSTVATVDKSGNANFTGTLQVGGTSQSTGAVTVRNNADAEVDYFLWPGYSSSQKGSFVYKDYNGSSQWYLVKDQSNNWALNSAVGGLDSFKAYQSNNSGDTYVNASNSSGAVRVNYESGSGSAFNIYGGNSSTLYAAFTGSAAIKFPGLAASSGHNCMQIDNSGWITNTGSTCGAGTVGAGTAGQVAWYSASGTAVTGMAAVPLSAGGTGASSAPAALANLGAVPASGGAMTGPLTGTSASFSGTLSTATALQAPNVPYTPVTVPNAGDPVCNGSGPSNHDCSPAVLACAQTGNCLVPPGTYYVAGVKSVGMPFALRGSGSKSNGRGQAVVFIHTGSGKMFDLENLTPSSGQNYGGIQNVELDAGSGTTDIIYLNQASSAEISNIYAVGTGPQTVVHTYSSLGSGTYYTRIHDIVPYRVASVIRDESDPDANTTAANNFTDLVASSAGVSGQAFQLVNSYWDNFWGGNPENNAGNSFAFEGATSTSIFGADTASVPQLLDTPYAPVPASNGQGSGGMLALNVSSHANGGVVTGCSVYIPGGSYPANANINVPVPGQGSGATVTAITNAGGQVSNCTVNAGGSGYSDQVSSVLVAGGNLAEFYGSHYDPRYLLIGSLGGNGYVSSYIGLDAAPDACGQGDLSGPGSCGLPLQVGMGIGGYPYSATRPWMYLQCNSTGAAPCNGFMFTSNTTPYFAIAKSASSGYPTSTTAPVFYVMTADPPVDTTPTPTAGSMALSKTGVIYTYNGSMWNQVQYVGTSSRGNAHLASGTATVSTPAACTFGNSCVYKFANCGSGGSTAYGILQLGSVTPGTSFVINSVIAGSTGIQSGDNSYVCWQIN